MSIPVARAAAGSSRAARSPPETAALVEKGDRDDPDGSAVAWTKSVVSGTVVSVSGPGPIFVQLLKMLYVTPRTANVAMPAPRQAHQRDADEQCEDAAGHGGEGQRGDVASRVLPEVEERG